MVEESERYLRKIMIYKEPMRAPGRLAGDIASLTQNLPCCCKDAKQQFANTEHNELLRGKI